MAISTQKYIRKPLYVDAVRITAGNFDEIAAWCQGEVQQDDAAGKKFIKVRVHNPKNPRQTKAFVGDWLLYTERGYKVYTNKAFHASFDVVPEQQEAVKPPASEVRQVVDPTLMSVGPVAADPSPEKGVGEIHEVVEATPQSIADEVQRQEAARNHHDADLAKAQQAKPVNDEPGITQVVPTEGEEPDKVEPSAAEGKRVLSLEEQKTMTPEELRELIQEGEVVLAQDLATP
jgi:hypothetical protein